MAINTCPGCGAALEVSPDEKQVNACSFCGWTAKPTPFPETSAELDRRHTAETLPLPKTNSEDFELSEPIEGRALAQPQSNAPEHEGESPTGFEPSGPEHFRELINETGSESQELLEQVPDEMRSVLADRMRDAEDDKPEFRKETVEQLQGAGYYVTEENNGARIGAVPGSSRSLEELSPSDVVKMAAELDGGLKPQTTLPMCAACQSASPIGSTTCQWCGEPLPQS